MTIATPAATADLDARQRGAAAPRTVVTPMRARGIVNQPEHRHRSREAGVPFLLEHDVVKVENVDNVTWEFKWDRRRYQVVPGETGLVPFPAVVMALGDPRSSKDEVIKYRTENGDTGIIPTRYDSFKTLFSRYAVEKESIPELVEFAPKVIVRHMETDDIITFPTQDPDHAPWPVPQHAAPGRENVPDRQLMQQIASENEGLRGEIAELRRMISEKLVTSDGPTSAAAVAGQPPVAPQEPADPMAAALLGFSPPGEGGATVDQGPSGTFE